MHGVVRQIVLLASAALLTTMALASCAAPGSTEQSGQNLIRVPQDVGTVTEAANRVKSGQTILISPGSYKESIVIKEPDVTVRGTDRGGVVFDGEGKKAEGILVIADGVRVENLTVKSYLFNGVLVTGLRDGSSGSARGIDGYSRLDPQKYPPLQRYRIDRVTAYNNGLYGVYVFNSQNGSITNSYASGSADSGFYLGQCRGCNSVISANIAENNAVGFENANASDSVFVTRNRFSQNRVGMTFTSNYQEAFSPQGSNVVAGNVISANASADSPAQADGAFGIGIGVSGGTKNLFSNNIIENNPYAGVNINNTEDLAAVSNEFSGNSFASNGVDYADTSNSRAPSRGNCLISAEPLKTLPANAVVPNCAEAKETIVSGVPVDQLPQLDVPKGVSFLKVAAPPQQTGMTNPEEKVSGKLPDRPEFPDPAKITVPTADYLKGNAGG